MIIRAIFDTAKLQWSFETEDNKDYAERLDVIIVSDVQVTFVKGVKIGVSVGNKEGIISELNWPPNGMDFETTDRTPITNVNLQMIPDTDYTITTWAKINETSDSYTGTFDYTKQKPMQPYPSWSWDGNTWQPPIPSPATEDRFYKWEESSTSWVEVTDQIAWASDYKDPEAKNPMLDK